MITYYKDIKISKRKEIKLLYTLYKDKSKEKVKLITELYLKPEYDRLKLFEDLIKNNISTDEFKRKLKFINEYINNTLLEKRREE